MRNNCYNIPAHGEQTNRSEVTFEDEFEDEPYQKLDNPTEELEETADLTEFDESVLEQSLSPDDEEYIFPGDINDLGNQRARVSKRQTKGQPPQRFMPSARVVMEY